MVKIWSSVAILIAFCMTGCVPSPVEPPLHVTTTVVPEALKNLPRPPPLLSESDQLTPWGQEYVLGQKFAAQGDYYRAATCFHRARFLLNNSSSPHQAQLLHALLLTYSLGNRYQEAVDAWETVQLSISIDDPGIAKDCISLLFEAYTHTNRPYEAFSMLNVLPQGDPQQHKLKLFSQMTVNDETAFLASPTDAARVGSSEEADSAQITSLYRNARRDPTTARVLNALLPGSGYLYVKQYQTAATAFAINALFIGATCQLFCAHQQAAAIIAGGLEGGWYLGGITGAGLAADQYNQRLRESLIKPYLEQYHLFPLRQLVYQW